MVHQGSTMDDALDVDMDEADLELHLAFAASIECSRSRYPYGTPASDAGTPKLPVIPLEGRKAWKAAFDQCRITWKGKGEVEGYAGMLGTVSSELTIKYG